MSSPEEGDRRNNRSPEDQDILERNTKKTKVMLEGHHDMDGIEMEIQSEEIERGMAGIQDEN